METESEMIDPPAHQGWEQLWRRGVSYGDAPQPEVVDLAGLLRELRRSRILDLGCGMGRHLLWLAAQGFVVCGCDISSAAVEACQRAVAASGLQAGVVRAEMTALPFKGEAFDAAIAWDVVFHSTLKGMLATLAGVRRSLRNGGLFLVTFNSVESSDRERAREAISAGKAHELEPETYVVPGDLLDKALPHHYTTEEEIRRSLLSGFDIVSMQQYVWEHEDVRGKHRHVKWWVLTAKQ